MSGARRSLLVALVAVLGIALAAAITWRTSQLVSQRIGLASEPLTAGRRLLPPASRTLPRIAAPSLRHAPTTGRSTTRSSLAPSTTASPGTPQPTTTSSAPAQPSPTSSAPPPSSQASGGSQPSSVASETPAASGPAAVRGSAHDGGGDSQPHRDD